jgi:transcriptional regulator with XRE-family HTH domain
MSSARARPDRRPSSTAGTGEGAPLVALVEAVLEQRDLDQRDVAEQLGLSVSAFRARLEQPGRLSRDDVQNLARALGVPRDRLSTAIAEAVRASPDDAPADAEDDAPVPIRPDDAEADAAVSDVAVTLRRTIAAIDDGPAGTALRLALLDGLRELVREAGYPPPPEYYDLRTRVQSRESFAGARAPMLGHVPDSEGEETADADAESTEAVDEDRAAVDLALAGVRRVQETGAGYADLFSPLHDDALGAVLARFEVRVHEAPLADGGTFVVTPRVHGRHLLVCAATGDVYRRAFARRQALGLVLAGALDDLAATNADPGSAARAHRAADLFALADVAPFWQIHDLRRARLGWAAVTDAMAVAVRAQTTGWSAERVRDRAALRVALYRKHGV